MMLDVIRVLAEQVRSHDLDHRPGRTLPAVHTALTYADRAILAMMRMSSQRFHRRFRRAQFCRF